MSLYDSLYCADYTPPRTGRLKLNTTDAADIRKLYRDCGWSQVDIAEHFGVSQPQISKIVNNLQWKGTSNG